MKNLFIFLFTMSLAFMSQAQELTAEHQQAAFDYIGTSQGIIVKLGQYQIDNNTITLDANSSATQKKAQKNSLIQKITTAIEEFEQVAAIEFDLGFRQATLDYAVAIKKIILKDANSFYIKQAEEATKCKVTSCFEAMQFAYKMQSKDLKESDVFYDKMNAKLDTVAKFHLIELEDLTAERNKSVDNMRAGVDYIFYVNLAIYKSVAVYNKLGKALNKIVKKKGSVVAFEKLEKEYKRDIKKATNFFYNLEQKDFKGDLTLYNAGDNTMKKLIGLAEGETLTEIKGMIENIATNKPTKEMADKINKLLKSFGEVRTAVQKYEKTRITFFNKLMAQVTY